MNEIEREKRVIGMMITMHSILKERYLFLSSLFENTLLTASIILNALVFVDNQFISEYTHLSENTLRLIIGITAILVFAISVLLIQVKWKEKARDHDKAVEHLFVLHQECRKIIAMENIAEKEKAIEGFIERYTQIQTIITKIPHKEFNALKLRHYRKVELSKLIDKHPGSLLFILKLKLLMSSLKRKND